MLTYNAIKAMASLSAANDHCQVASGANRSCLITEIDNQGGHTSSVSLEVGLYRVTTQGTGTAPATTPVPTPTSESFPAFTGLFYTGGAWGTAQPVLGAQVQPCNLNANGQRHYWRCQIDKSDALVIRGGGGQAGALSLRGSVGGQPMSAKLKIVEF